MRLISSSHVFHRVIITEVSQWEKLSALQQIFMVCHCMLIFCRFLIVVEMVIAYGLDGRRRSSIIQAVAD